MANDAAYWDDQARLKATKHGPSDNYQKKRRIVKYLLDYNLDGKRCIEIGCGLATVAASIMLPNRLKVKYLGLDVSYEFARNTRKYFNLPVICAESRDIPVKDNSFDFCLCLDSMEHIPSKHKWKTWKELSRVLRHTATIYINNPMYISFHDKKVEHGFSLHDLADLCLAGDFSIYSIRTYSIQELNDETYQFIELRRNGGFN